jgi:putative heme transporter
VKTVPDTGVAQRCTRDLRGYPEGVSHDAAAGYVDGTHEERSRGRYWWLRWVALAVVTIVLAIEVALAWDQLAKAARSLYTAKWWWLLASALAAVLLMHSFAEVQRTLLASAGLRVRELRSEAAYYAANALSTTLPGGPVLAATFLLRQQRVWGASTLVASWQLVMSGVLQAVGLALLGLGGAFFLGARNNPFSLVFTLGGFVALLLLAQAVASRPELIDGIGGRVLSMFNSIRGRPANTGLAKWREMLCQLESVSLSRRDMATAFSWSLVNRFADVACLGFAAYAAGAHASLGGLTVACAAARAAGTIPLLPGAVSTMLIYRLISWLLLAAVGWVVFFFMFRTDNELDPDDGNAPDTLDAAAAEAAQSDNETIAEPGDAALQGPLAPPENSPVTPESAT